ncbi:hypothetical protein K523DRAFT_412330 [Schizophyllum commune Tattone D]|nr:hypothetical protein K523DRAFT_412330 [Schizophyllum commune Tattone D]
MVKFIQKTFRPRGSLAEHCEHVGVGKGHGMGGGAERRLDRERRRPLRPHRWSLPPRQVKLVALGGVAELIANAICMSIGGFLGSQSKRDHCRYLKHHTAACDGCTCKKEMECKVTEILGPIVIDPQMCILIGRSLRKAADGADSSSGQRDELEGLLLWAKDDGLIAFLLEEVHDKCMYIPASTIDLRYLLGSLVPLIYLFIPRAHTTLIYSSVFIKVLISSLAPSRRVSPGLQGASRTTSEAW